MPVTPDYERLKEPDTNTTGMLLTLLAAEEPTAPIAVAAGTSGVLDARLQVDADESGGVDVQDLFRYRLVPQITGVGVVTVAVVVTPVLGDGSDGTPVTMTVTHDENMDAFQTAAGRPRQV